MLVYWLARLCRSRFWVPPTYEKKKRMLTVVAIDWQLVRVEPEENREQDCGGKVYVQFITNMHKHAENI